MIEVSPAVWWEMRVVPSWRLLEGLPAPIPPVFLGQVIGSPCTYKPMVVCVICDDVDARSLFVDI